MTDIEVIKSLDLHYGRIDFSGNKNYVEFSFFACFYELLNVENSSWETNLTGNEIFEIFSLLEIDVNKNLLIERYSNQLNHDVEAFHSKVDEQVFTYFDLQKDPTDQNDMIFLGFRVLKSDEDAVHLKLLNIYKKLMTTSPFQYYRGDILYNKTFKSYYYFYEQNYNQHKRRINHHNLQRH